VAKTKRFLQTGLGYLPVKLGLETLTLRPAHSRHVTGKCVYTDA